LLFLSNYAVFDIVENSISQEIKIKELKELTIGFLKLPCWKSTSKDFSSSFHGI
jgi:hypothetical protein